MSVNARALRVFHLNMVNHIFFSFTWNRLFVPLHSSWSQWNGASDLAKYWARDACSMTKHTICQKKTDLLRWTETSGRLTTKMEIQRFVLNCLFQVAVIVMLFCYVALSVVKTLQSIARKICVNVHQELNVFREFREDRNSPVWDKGRLF